MAERVFLLAAARDRQDIEYIGHLPEKDRIGLGGSMGFVRIPEEDG